MGLFRHLYHILARENNQFLEYKKSNFFITETVMLLWSDVSIFIREHSVWPFNAKYQFGTDGSGD